MPKASYEVGSKIFRPGDRVEVPDAFLSETKRVYVKHDLSATKVEQFRPRDVPDFTTAAEFGKRTHVKLGTEDDVTASGTHKRDFPLYAGVYAENVAQRAGPRNGSSLHFGDDGSSFATETRAAFREPSGGGPGRTHEERLRINLEINKGVGRFAEGGWTDGSFETTQAAANTQVTGPNARAKAAAAKAAGSNGPGVQHNSTSIRLAEGVAPEFRTETRDQYVRHPQRSYVEREPPVDPARTGGALALSSTMAVVDTRTGQWGQATRVQSALDIGHDAPQFVTEAMAATRTAAPVLTKMGGFKRHEPFVPVVQGRLIKAHPAIKATKLAMPQTVNNAGLGRTQ